MINSIEYFWGLFKDPANADPSDARQHIRLEGAEITEAIQSKFIEEKIGELQGEYGLKGVGQPEQLNILDITVDGESRQIRVSNLAISLFRGEDPVLVRLIRFFSALDMEDED